MGNVADRGERRLQRREARHQRRVTKNEVSNARNLAKHGIAVPTTAVAASSSVVAAAFLEPDSSIANTGNSFISTDATHANSINPSAPSLYLPTGDKESQEDLYQHKIRSAAIVLTPPSPPAFEPSAPALPIFEGNSSCKNSIS